MLAVIGINNIIVFSWTCEFKLIGYLLVVVKEVLESSPALTQFGILMRLRWGKGILE